MWPHPLLHAHLHPLQIVDVPDVELAEKLSGSRRRENRLGPQQFLCPRISTQDLQITQMLPAQDQVID